MQNYKPNYIVLDGAKMRFDLEKAQELNEDHKCLYRGDSAVNLGPVAPWLFTYESNTPFSNWLYKNSSEQHWGILLQSNEIFTKIYTHLRKFLMVKTEEGKQLYFRFYDPRVLNTFLPSCEADQLSDFFGPVEAYFSETSKNQSTIFTFDKTNKELVETPTFKEEFA